MRSIRQRQVQTPQRRPTEFIRSALGKSKPVSELHPIIRLQRTLGNQAVARMLNSQKVQSSMTFGEPDDRYEPEADCVSEQLMRMTSAKPEDAFSLNRAASRSTVNITCDDCEEKIRRTTESPGQLEEENFEEEDRTIRAKEFTGRSPTVSLETDGWIRGLHGRGQPLPRKIRDSMGLRFGHDFDGVQVHSYRDAALKARSLGARAFTYGQDIVFDSGQYAPHTGAGQRLLAHELTHVVQQGGAPARKVPGKEVGFHGATLGMITRDVRVEISRVKESTIRRVAWTPYCDTGRKVRPWKRLNYVGSLLEAATDAGNKLNTWLPDDGSTYWCHGYTFGGTKASGGPYSFWGSSVPGVLADDGWTCMDACGAQDGDILVFPHGPGGYVAHTGIVRSVSAPGNQVDENASTLESKWGPGSHNTSSWTANIRKYGNYRCYSKLPVCVATSARGNHEDPCP